MGSLRLFAVNDVLESKRRDVLGTLVPVRRYHGRISPWSSPITVGYGSHLVVSTKDQILYRRTAVWSYQSRCIASDTTASTPDVQLDEFDSGCQRGSLHDEVITSCSSCGDSDSNLTDFRSRSTEKNTRNNRRRNIWTRLLKIKKSRKQRSSVQGENGAISARKLKEGSTALELLDSGSSTEQWNSKLRYLAKLDGEKALQFFELMKDNGKLAENIDAYQVIFRVVVRKEDWAKADILLQEMVSYSKCHLMVEIFNYLIFVCSKRGLVSLATNWFHVMLRENVQPNASTIGTLMGLYQRGGNLSEAEFAFEYMRKNKLECVKAYSAMVTIYTRMRLYTKSEEVIALMQEDGVHPNLENWLVQLNAYSQQGKVTEAEMLLESMQELGISPNIVAYNTLITGYGKNSDMKSAKRVYSNLQDIGLAPDDTTIRSMIEGYGRDGNYKEASVFYNKLKELGLLPSSSNFYTMLSLQARLGDDDGAITTIEDMRAAGCQNASILGLLVQAYERAGRMDKVLRILESSCYNTILADATSCSILVMAFVKNTLLDDALQVLCDKKWNDQEFEDNLYHLLICSCKEAGNYNYAMKIYNQMSNSEKPPNLHIGCSMIDIYSLVGKFSEAENIYFHLKESMTNFDMIGYSIVARMYIKAGRLKDACSIFETMEKKKDIVPDKYLFCDMLRTYQRCAMLEKLADTYYWICRSGIQLDEAMYNCVINCCGRALPIDEVSRIFDEMIQHGHSANTITYNILLDIYGKARMFNKAQKVFMMACKQGLADIVSYNTIIAAYGQTKDYKSMEFYIQRMQNAGFAVSLEVYNCLLDAYGKDDRLEEFDEVLQKMKEARYNFDHYTYNIMINIYGKKGWIEEVANVLSDLKSRSVEPDLYSYNSLIKAYGIAGMTEEAVGVVQEMRTKGYNPDRVTFANLIRSLQRNEDFLEAVKWSLWMKQMGCAK